MSDLGRIFAQLAYVAQRDADAAYEKRRPDVREGERLQVLGDRFAYRARALGFCEISIETTFGPAPQTFKRCRCGLRYSASEWEDLPFVGRQRVPGERYVLELRTCSCASTLAIRRLPARPRQDAR